MPQVNSERRPIAATPWRVWPRWFLVLLAFASASGLLLLLLAQSFLIELSTTEVAEALANLVGNVPLIGNALNALAGSLGLALWLEARLLLSSFFIGFLIGVPAFWKLSRRAALGLFAPIDQTIAAPILPPQTALEPLRPMLGADLSEKPLPWLEPAAADKDAPASQRYEVWQGLHRFVADTQSPFEYLLLLGGPGAGKTRMSVEFSRRFLAKTDALGNHPTILHGPDNRDLQITRRQRLFEWLHTRVLARPPRAQDIWHIGWFNAQANSMDGSRMLLNAALSDTLPKWRPTRPTFLLLDDPLHSDAEFIVRTLAAQSEHFRHPVRLLIANQTIPSDLGFVQKSASSAWQSNVHAPFGPPLILSHNASLSGSDIRRLLAGLPQARIRGEYSRDTNIEIIRTATRGNPLLVELAFSWLMDGKPIHDLSEEALLEDRTLRFIAAVKAATTENADSLLDMLTMATIAQGAPTTLPKLGDADEQAVWDHFRAPRIGPDLAKRLFPAETELNLSGHLPPLRPETIGIAFARTALSQRLRPEWKTIISAAWRANPQGTLRTLLRVDGGYKLRKDHEDPLKLAFDCAPIGVTIPPAELLRLYLQVSCCARADDWAEARYFVGEPLMKDALALAETVDDGALIAGFAQLTTWIATPPDAHHLRQRMARGGFTALLGQIAQRGLLADTQVIAALKHWLDNDQYEAGDQNIDLPHPVPWNAATLAAIYDATCTAPMRSARLQIWPLIIAAATGQTDATSRALDDMAQIALEADRAISDQDGEKWQALADRLQAAQQTHAGKWQAAPQRLIWGHAFVIFACGLGQTIQLRETAAKLGDAMDTFASAAAHDPAIHFARAATWRFVTYAHSNDRALSQQYAQKVAAIVAQFPLNEEMQRECAGAWRLVTSAHEDDRALSQRFAEKVAAIASQFPLHEGIQFECAEAWRFVTYAHRNDRALSQQFAQKVATLAVQFPLHEQIQFACALAWRFVTYAHKDDHSLSQHFAQKVATIAAQFPLHEEIQRECADAWRNVTYAHRNDRALSQSFAQKIAVIAAQFPLHEQIQLECATAWRVVTAAHEDDRALSQHFAQKVAAIAAKFPLHERMQKECADAWRHVTWAHSDDLGLSQHFAQKVTAIAAKFPLHEVIQSECAMAWRLVTYAHRDDRALSQNFAQKVAAIADQFPLYEVIQYECAIAWRHVIYAHRTNHTAALPLVAKIEQIAARLSGNAKIQEELRTARSYLLQQHS